MDDTIKCYTLEGKCSNNGRILSKKVNPAVPKGVFSYLGYLVTQIFSGFSVN